MVTIQLAACRLASRLKTKFVIHLKELRHILLYAAVNVKVLSVWPTAECDRTACLGDFLLASY